MMNSLLPRSFRTLSIAIPAALILATAQDVQAKARQADFNGDGRADLAIGVPQENVGGEIYAGGVSVIYGKNSSGLDDTNDQFWTADSSGVNGLPEADALFGESLAAGDFDGDGFTDLAIGIPYRTVGGMAFAGQVEVLYGSANGLSSSGDQLWHENVNGVLGDASTTANFGTALAAGDFDGDGKDDLAIGASGKTIGGAVAAGDVHVLYGSNQGLTASADQVFNQDTTGIIDTVEADDAFGATLASGDFDHDGKDDLAIGAPFENIVASANAGTVHVLYGTSHGLDADGSQTFVEGVDGLSGSVGADEYFGQSLAIGDFDNNGKDDLAIGVIGEDAGGQEKSGIVYVLYGSSSGLKINGHQTWSQDSNDIRDACEAGDNLATSLAAGDFDGDGKDDLAIASTYDDLDGITNCGAVNVLYGTSAGLKATGNQLWHQNSSGMKDSNNQDDTFGSALTAGDYDGDGIDDLAVGVSGESVDGNAGSGAVSVIYGKNGSGLNSAGNQFWTQDSQGINDAPAANEYFGFSLR